MDEKVEKIINGLCHGDCREFSTYENGPFDASVEVARTNGHIKLRRKDNGIVITVNVERIYSVEEVGYTIKEAIKKEAIKREKEKAQGNVVN